jgi:hypothetical protein
VVARQDEQNGCRRPWLGGRASAQRSRAPTASVIGIGNEGGREGENVAEGDDPDPGKESDPDDSETPWACTLKIRQLYPPVVKQLLSYLSTRCPQRLPGFE